MVPRKTDREAEGRPKNRIPSLTVVGARPPRGESLPRRIPRGLEVLVKKAAVDPGFKKILLDQRAGAAEAIGLKLIPSEEAMLAAVPVAQLEGIIAHARVSPKFKPVFLGYAAGAMLAALGGSLLICTSEKREPNTYSDNDGLARKSGVAVKPPSAEKSDLRNAEESFGRGIDRIGTLGIRPGTTNLITGRGRSISVPSPPSVGGTGAADADRAPTAIASIIQIHLPGIENVYNSTLKKNPNLGSGKVTLKFTITSSGDVTSVETVQNTIGAPGLSNAIISRVRSWRFPPVSGGDVTVIYPFVFIAEEG